MRVLLFQIDGSLPNLALMRLAAHHRSNGDEVTLRQARTVAGVERCLFDAVPDRAYASLIFEKSRPVAERLRQVLPHVVLGGTGWDLATTLEQHGVGGAVDYDDYPAFTASIGFSQRGCRLRCPFCVVPRKEGAARPEATIAAIWRGPPWPRHVILLDNDFFGQLGGQGLRAVAALLADVWRGRPGMDAAGLAAMEADLRTVSTMGHKHMTQRTYPPRPPLWMEDGRLARLPDRQDVESMATVDTLLHMALSEYRFRHLSYEDAMRLAVALLSRRGLVLMDALARAQDLAGQSGPITRQAEAAGPSGAAGG